MKEYVLLLFIVVHITTCEKATDKLKRKLIVPKISTECRKIKCSSVEAPECVKLTRLDWNTTFHIIVINKCELDYIKCHDDVEAKIVPMKYCGHTNAKKYVNKHKKPAGLKRVKRYLRHLRESNSVPNKFASHKRRKQLRSSGFAGVAGHSVHAFDYDEHISISTSSDEIIKKNHKYTQGPHKMEAKSVNLDFASFPMVSEESRYENHTGIVLIDADFYDSCPSVCPSRDVMVCAKCQHGIYKTFVSVCHMRIFTCHHSDEVLQLIARYPCVMSAPYLSEPEMKPVGRVMEDTDDDMVLNYIMHRDNGLIGNSEESTPDIGPKIVGGKNITITDAPYQAALLQYGRFMCGGSIIGNDVVLTAAHCVIDRQVAQYTVRVGSSFSRKGGSIYSLRDMVLYPTFKKGNLGNDIAILWLSEPLTFSDRVAQVDLIGFKEEINDGELTVVTGWGRIKEGGDTPKRLQKIVIPKINATLCKDAYKSIFKITRKMLCAGTAGKDSCQGDSGGPLVYKNKLAGVVAFGLGCARPKYPGVYTKVSEFRPWIDDEIKKSKLSTQ